MAFNTIQFQHGMSVPEFIKRFGTEEQCAEAVKAARWPNGFRCLRCAAPEHRVVGHGARKLFQCQACQYQTSLTVGSLFEHTKLPLRTWFLAIYLLSQAKTGMSSLALMRALGVSYPTDWALQHKINHAMALRQGQHRLAGTVQLDDAYLGGEHPGGKPGRGSENKTPFVAAVSLNDRGRPQFLKLNRVSAFTSEALKSWAEACLAPTARVVSDGLGCFAAVTAAGCSHTPVVVGNRKPRDLPQFQWVNTILGNLKTTLHGAFHSLAWAKHADSHLAAFAYRFNRRFELRDLLARLIVDVARCPAHQIRSIRGGAEAHY
jgi:transposase-like protein